MRVVRAICVEGILDFELSYHTKVGFRIVGMAVTSFALVLFVEPARTAAVGPTIRHYLTWVWPK